jgi:putative two-component system response regulator
MNPPPPRKRILLVDDEPACLRGYDLMLRGQSKAWELDFALNVSEALGKIAERPFDAIVSDLRMPAMDGFEFLRRLRAAEATRDIPFTIVTGAGDDGVKRQALEMGATDLLSKPVSTEDLLARIRNMLLLKACQDELREQNRLLDQRVRERTAQLEASHRHVVWRLAKAGEYRDEITGHHVVRVGWYCRTMAEAMGRSGDYCERIFLASPLHDIGKVGIPDGILLKPGRLDAREWDLMRRHCDIGAAILGAGADAPGGDALRWLIANGPAVDNPFLDMAETIARAHHENWDGSGYPRGLAGETIPLEARLVTVADTYDALISARPYKTPMPHAAAVAIMDAEAPRRFDPEVYRIFKEGLERIRDIASLLTDENMDASADGGPGRGKED